MKSSAHVSIGLSPGGESPRAVEMRTGAGANLWLGSIVITVTSADQFSELAKAALEAAEIQQRCDDAKTKPHPFVISETLKGLPAPSFGWTCMLCDRLASEHTK